MNENIIARVDAWLTGPGFTEDERRLELGGAWMALVGFWRRAPEGAVRAAFAAALSGVLLALVRDARGVDNAHAVPEWHQERGIIGWNIWADDGSRILGCGVTEQDALAAALEAAP